MLLRSPRFWLYSFLSVCCVLASWAVHHSAQDATWLARQAYPFKVLLSSGNEQCSGPQQKMLSTVLKAARQHGSLISQVVYWSPDSGLSSCSSAERGETPNPNARYRYASLTKLLTAQAILKAMAEHKLPLDTPLSHFISQAGAAQDQRWAQVTIEQLLTHSAGLNRLRSPDPMTRHAVTPWCPNNLDRLLDVKLDFAPGTGYGYSNLTYCLLGVVLEKLTKQPYRDAITQKLALKDYGISFIDGPYTADEVTYDFRHTGFYSEDYYKHLDFTALSSSAGLSGTAQSLVQWLVAQRQAKQLSVTQPVWPEHCDLTRKRSCYGYAAFPYRQAGQSLTVQVQQGYVFGASSSLLLDEHGGIFLWLGNGTAPQGSASDHMLDAIYLQLVKHYAK